MPLPQQHRYRVLLTVLVIAAGLLVSLWLGGRYAEQRAWDERSVEARGQLQLYAQSIRTLVERFSSVPEVLALDSDIRSLLRAPHDRQLRLALNQRLERLNAAAGSTVLYLLDAQGETLVASNWRDWSSFVGNNYAFRPYFQNALREGGARYFAVGVTTGIPGYFLSHVVRDEDGSLIGVLVVKLELEELQREWVDQPGVLLVADSHQVAILSNRPAWRFRTLQALDDQARAELIDVRKYAEQALKPLPSRVHRYIDDETAWTRMDGPDGARDYLWQRMTLPDEGWTLHLLSDPGNLADARLSYRLAAAGVWMTFAFLLLFLFQRRKNQRLQAGIRERLEREVAGRPEAVRDGLQRIDGLLQRMAALTGHLKTFARKTPAGLSERLCLGDVLEQALQLLAPRMRSEQVELRTQIDDEAEVLGDAIRIEQVILNLLHNALDAMAESETRILLVRIAREDDGCLLSVEDSGGGIAEETLGRVFEPFFTTKPVGQGLGLGLAVSYGIVRDLGGTLEAHNGELGAVFTLRLPAAP
ncbi:cytochrome C biogenesis protein CcmE [Pseudomonas sp. 1-7]|nr:cytochrome C biogenesis protein CcmE [Pseudomonas sp. 1-7]